MLTCTSLTIILCGRSSTMCLMKKWRLFEFIQHYVIQLQLISRRNFTTFSHFMIMMLGGYKRPLFVFKDALLTGMHCAPTLKFRMIRKPSFRSVSK